MEDMIDRIRAMLKLPQSLAPRRIGALPLLALWAALMLGACGQKGPLLAAKPTNKAAAAPPSPASSQPAQ